MELAWCYFQNEKLDDCINLLEELPDTARREYDFINLYGRAYLALGKYDLALDKLKVWLQALDTKKTTVKNQRKDMADWVMPIIQLAYTIQTFKLMMRLCFIIKKH